MTERENDDDGRDVKPDTKSDAGRGIEAADDDDGGRDVKPDTKSEAGRGITPDEGDEDVPTPSDH